MSNIRGKRAKPHHEAKISPLVEEIAIDVDGVRLRQILGDQLPDGGEILRFLFRLVAHIRHAVCV